MDWVEQICSARSSRAGCIRGYMVVTASLKGTRSMALIWLASTETWTLTCSFPRRMEEVYTPGVYRASAWSEETGASVFPGRNMNRNRDMSRMPKIRKTAV